MLWSEKSGVVLFKLNSSVEVLKQRCDSAQRCIVVSQGPI